MYPENISFQILVRYLVDKNILLEYDNYRPDWKKLIQDINPKDREKVLEKLEFLNDILER
jgi:ABC-type phosphate/phosphonate transport system ATPase subunit